MKINLFFDVGNTLHYPVTKSWFITPNFFNITHNIDREAFEKAIKKNLHLLDEREINTEEEEFDMFSKFYLKCLQEVKYPDITEKTIHDLAYDCVYNDEKVRFYEDVKEILTILSKEYNLYIISNAWPSTYRVLKNYGILNLFKNVFISSDLGYKKEDKTLFEIALKDIDPLDTNYFIDDRYDLLQIAEEFGFIPIIIDRDKNKETNYIEIENLNDLLKVLEYEKK